MKLLVLVSIATSTLWAQQINPSDLRQGGAALNQVLMWDGNKWVPSTVAGSGTVTNIATSCGVVGGPVTGSGTLKRSPALTAQAGNYTTAAGDCGLTVKLTGASPAVTISTAGGSFPNGWYQDFSFTGTGTTVYTPVSGTINGVGSVSLAAANGAGGRLISDGSNWVFISGGGSGGGAGTVTHTVGALPGNQLVFGNGAGDVKAGDLTGDVTTSGSGVTTLGNSGVTAGSCGSATQSCGLTITANGRITAQANNTITGIPVSAVTNAAAVNASNTYTGGTDDHSGAAHTLPSVKGTVAGKPATCTVGEEYFGTDATAGQNKLYCTATNTWTQQLNSGGGSQMSAQLLDIGAVKTSSTRLTFGALCSASVPCNIGSGAAMYSLTAPFTVDVSGTGATSTIFVHLAHDLTMVVGHNSAATMTCSAGCAVATGVSAFPGDAVATLWQITFTANVWDAITGAMDKRAFVKGTVIQPGPGISSARNGTTGEQTLSTDPTITPRYFTGAIAPTPGAPNCTAGRDRYTDTVGLHDYFCDALNTWKQADGGGTVTEMHTFQPCAADANAGVARSLWDIITVGAGPVILGGSIGNPCGLGFNNSGTAEARIYYALNTNWSGTVTLTFETESLAGAGVTNTLSVKTACVGNGGNIVVPSFNAAQTVTFVSNASANVLVNNSIASLTMTGCVGENTLIIDVTKTDVNATLNVIRAKLKDSHS